MVILGYDEIEIDLPFQCGVGISPDDDDKDDSNLIPIVEWNNAEILNDHENLEVETELQDDIKM